MGSKGDCFDNAVTESFFATLEKDLLRRRSFATRQEARTAVFDYIEAFYNPVRLHSTLDYLSPVEYETSIERDRKPPKTCPPNRRRSQMPAADTGGLVAAAGGAGLSDELEWARLSYRQSGRLARARTSAKSGSISG
jgi:hypothetical protein